MEVVYQGIRLSPAEIAAAARDEDVDVVGLSILSGSHLALVPETLAALRAAGVDAPVVVGGIIPDADRAELEAMGVARVYTPKDFRMARIMADIAELARAHRLDESSGQGGQPPMRSRMEDPRLLVAVSGGLAALAAGAVGVATSAPVLAVVAGGAGVIAAVAGVALGAEARRNGDQLGQAEDELRTMRRELASINAVLQEESSRRAAEDELGPPDDIDRRPQREGLRPRNRSLRRAVLRGARAATRCRRRADRSARSRS